MARRKNGGENVGPSESWNGRTVENGEEEQPGRSQMPQRRQERWVGTPLMGGGEQAQHACNISTPQNLADLSSLPNDSGLQFFPIAPLDEHLVALQANNNR